MMSQPGSAVVLSVLGVAGGKPGIGKAERDAGRGGVRGVQQRLDVAADAKRGERRRAIRSAQQRRDIRADEIAAPLRQLPDDVDDLVEVLFIGCERADGHSALPLDLRRTHPP